MALHSQATDTFWTGTSYLLASAVVQPFITRLSDVFGRRSLLLASLLLFTTGTVICCVSENLTLLLAGRSVQGIGGGGCFSMTHVIITDIIPLRQRPTYQSLTSVAWAIATITGPLIGGIFAQHSTWRWCFYLNFPFCLITIVMTALVIQLDTARPDISFFRKVLLVDWIGGGLFIGSTCSFLIGLTWAGSEHSWSSFQTLMPISAGIVSFAVTILWETMGAKEPFLRLKIFKAVTSNVAFFCAFLQGLIVGIVFYFWQGCIANTESQVVLSTLLPSFLLGDVQGSISNLRWHRSHTLECDCCTD